MSKKPTYEELEKRIEELEKTELRYRKAESALEKSEYRFRQIFENTATGITILDLDGKFLHCNPACC